MRLRLFSLTMLAAVLASPAHAIETRSACITVNDVQIVSGEEKTVQKQLCRSAGSARYDVVVDSTYGAASTQSAFDRASNSELRVLRGQIEAMRGQVRAGQASNDTLRAELSRAQQDFVAKLAERDRAYAAEISVFRGKLVDITRTERGTEALAKIAAGDVAGGDAIFNELTAANDLAVAARSAIEKAKPRRDHADVMLNERNKGRWPTEKVIAQYQEVVGLDPGVFADWIELSRLYQDAGRLSDAAEAVGRARQTAQSDRDRSVALIDLGKILVLQGDFLRADAAFAESLAIRRKLAAADQGNAQAQRDVFASLSKTGDVRVAQGHLARAHEAYAESLTIARKLAAADPGNAGAQRDVWISLDRIGNVRVAQGDLARADTANAESLTIARKLAAADPGNAEVQRDASLSLERIGDVRKAQGDLARADAAYSESLAIARKLAAADPGNAEAQRDIWVSMSKLADRPNAGIRWSDVVAQMEKMEARAILDPADRPFLDEARARAKAQSPE